ncbi:MAG: YybH family protein [Acidobacteriota bacterium]
MRITLTLILVSFFFACAPPAEAPAPEIDLAAERSALRDADKAWYQEYSSSDTPVDTLLSHMLDDARFQFAENPPAQGKEAIRGILDQMVSTPGFELVWSPSAAEVASSGDLGYTVGTYQMKMEGPDGPVTIDGHYVTIWKKQADGSWKVAVDTGGPSGPPPAPGEQ